MGTDLEDTLKELNKFRSQIGYWFTCMGEPLDEMLIKLLDEVEARCKEMDAWVKSE